MKDKLVSLFVELFDEFSAKDVCFDTSFKDLGLDSLDFVELIMYVEEEFDVDIQDDEAENLKTLNDILQYLTKQ